MDRVPGEARRRVLRAASLVLPTVIALAALAGLGFGAYALGIEGPLLRARAVRFEGLARVSETELRELSPVREGDHVLLVDLDGVEAALRRHPWIASVEVRRAFPPAFVVTVEERRAAALVELGGLYLVDDHGRVFKRAAPGDGLDLPLLTGIGREDWISRRAEAEPVLGGALALLDRWSERGLDRRARISEIHVDPEYGVTVYAGDDGMEVRLGTGDLPQKLERLDRVLSALDARSGRAEVVHLDNRRRPDWVAVRMASAGPAGGGWPGASGGSGGAQPDRAPSSSNGLATRDAGARAP